MDGLVSENPSSQTAVGHDLVGPEQEGHFALNGIGGNGYKAITTFGKGFVGCGGGDRGQDAVLSQPFPLLGFGQFVEI